MAQLSEAKKFNAKRLPIIEFAFEDIRILKQIQKIIKPKQGVAETKADGETTDVFAKVAEKAGKNNKIGKDTTDKDLETEIEKRKRKDELHQKKKDFENDKKIIKVRLDEYTLNPAKATKEAVLGLLKLARSHRGLKQRIKKKFPAFFKDEPKEDAVIAEKKNFKRDASQSKQGQNGRDSRSGSEKPRGRTGDEALGKRRPDFAQKKLEDQMLKKEEQKLMNHQKNKKKLAARKFDQKDSLDVS